MILSLSPAGTPGMVNIAHLGAIPLALLLSIMTVGYVIRLLDRVETDCGEVRGPVMDVSGDCKSVA